jgi:hypothetical protein
VTHLVGRVALQVSVEIDTGGIFGFAEANAEDVRFDCLNKGMKD